jgi:hypothetical protein
LIVLSIDTYPVVRVSGEVPYNFSFVVESSLRLDSKATHCHCFTLDLAVMRAVSGA